MLFSSKCRISAGALMFLLFFGCSNPNNGAIFNPDSGTHPANWVADHPAAFLRDQTVCAECHGADMLGGISQVSCFSPDLNGTTCHSSGPGHADPATWGTPTTHGVSAKAAPDPAAMHGFGVCKVCHGANFQGSSFGPACDSCHGGSAPHPVSWISGTYTHTNTDQGNAAVCAQCHTNGANSPIAPPSPPAPAGTAPGCFNNTLCHAAAGHPAGWSDPSQHGTSAKAAPNASAMHGFGTCEACHATDFSGGIANTACDSCHGGSAPHPVSWISGTFTHTNTDQGNAAVCAQCHTNGANSPIAPPSPPAAAGTAPGCFNSTLCHGQVGHPAGWSDPSQHGTSAKAAPNASAMQGFSTCQSCHGSLFQGSGSIPSCSSCHGGSAPHPTSWIEGTYHHTNTNQANASVCFLCHANGANSPLSPPSPRPAAGTPPGCFNGTLCHYNPG